MKEPKPSEKASRNRLPARFKAAEAVARRQALEGELPLARLPRLTEALAGEAAPLRISLAFTPHPRAVGRVQGRVEGALPLTCQRSLAVFDWPLATDFDWILVRDEAEETRFLADADPVMLVDEELMLHEAIEDEVLLALPLVPIAPGADTPQKKPRGETNGERISDNPRLDDSRPNPFLALKSQFSKN